MTTLAPQMLHAVPIEARTATRPRAMRLSGNPLDLRVAIIGAGPSGLATAWHFAQLGMRNVELFDAAPEIGGQSVTHRLGDVSVELGTCYLTDGYALVRGIAAAVGVAVERLPPATVFGADGRVELPPAADRRNVARYMRAWFGWYGSGQMWAPTHPDNALPFSEWLDRRGLSGLRSEFSFSAGLTAQLYGPAETITAHNGLTWLRPSLFVTGQLKRTAAIPLGFGTLWRRVAEQVGYRVHLGTAVSAVRGTVAADGSRRVQLFDGVQPIGAAFDHVVITCPLDGIDHPLSARLRADGHAFDSTPVYSAIWRARGWPDAAPSRCYLPACTTGEAGRLLTIRRNGVLDGHALGQLCAYAVAGESLEQHRGRVLADARAGLGLADVEIVADRLWRYNVRFSAGQLRSGLPGAIDHAQGEANVWYAGGTLSHWNIDSITDGSHRFTQRFARAIGAPIDGRWRLVRMGGLLRDI